MLRDGDVNDFEKRLVSAYANPSFGKIQLNMGSV